MAAQKFLLAAALATSALAVPILEDRQSSSCGSTYAQCGGTGWSGATCCVSGSVCTYTNDYYSQCLPGTATTTAASSSTSKASTSSSTVASTSTSKTSTTVVSSQTTTAPAGTGTYVTFPTCLGLVIDNIALVLILFSKVGVPLIQGSVLTDKQAFYASEISASAIPSLTGTQVTQASEVAKVPSYVWLDTAAKVDTVMVDTLQDIRAANDAGASPPYAGLFVVYDLPDRDCAAAASNGEYTIANNGVENYKAYIDSIVTVIKEYSDIRHLLIIEPDSLANMVTNLNVAECAEAQSAYYECINYALIQLNLDNVAMYIDAGHAGWLGWSANIGPAAELFGQVYANASKPAAVRGLATNVANYNGWNLASAPSYTAGDSNYDEYLYVTNFQPLLAAQGFDAYFITDQSRSGVQPTEQQAWGDWCNVIGTGFGTRPTTDTGLSIEDAFVWVKPGGESDGTSNTSSTRYDYHCGYSDALQPAPEAGTWFQAYFVQLLTNANPAF